MLTINRSTIWNQVADIIEENPARYDFFQARVPIPGGFGCLWALAGEVLGMDCCTPSNAVVKVMGLEDEISLFEEMTKVGGHDEWEPWIKSSKEAVRCLRLLAQQEEVAA